MNNIHTTKPPSWGGSAWIRTALFRQSVTASIIVSFLVCCVLFRISSRQPDVSIVDYGHNTIILSKSLREFLASISLAAANDFKPYDVSAPIQPSGQLHIHTMGSFDSQSDTVLKNIGTDIDLDEGEHILGLYTIIYLPPSDRSRLVIAHPSMEDIFISSAVESGVTSNSLHMHSAAEGLDELRTSISFIGPITIMPWEGKHTHGEYRIDTIMVSQSRCIGLNIQREGEKYKYVIHPRVKSMFGFN